MNRRTAPPTGTTTPACPAMTDTTTPTPQEAAVTEAAHRLAALQAERDRITAALPSAPAAFDLAKLNEARQSVTTLAASVALGEAQASKLEEARKDLAKLEASQAAQKGEQRKVEEVASGLRERLAVLGQQIKKADEDRAAAEVAMLQSLLATASAAYIEAGRAVAGALVRFFGIHEALARRGIEPNNVVNMAMPLKLPIVDEASRDARDSRHEDIGGWMKVVNGRFDARQEADELEAMLERLGG